MNSRTEKSDLDLVVVFLGDAYLSSANILEILQDAEVSFVYDASDNPITKKLEFATSQNAAHIMFVDQNEISDGLFALKNLKTNKEYKHSIERIISIVKDYRHKVDSII